MPDDPTPPAAPPADPPATATAVAAGDADEADAAELVRLQQLLDAERARDKQRTTRIAELENELHELKQAMKAPAKPEPKPDDLWEQIARL